MDGEEKIVLVSDLLTYIQHCKKKSFENVRVSAVCAHFYTQAEIDHAKNVLIDNWTDLGMTSIGKPPRVRPANKALPEKTVKINEVTSLCQIIDGMDATSTNVIICCSDLDRLPPKEEGVVSVYLLNMKAEDLQKRMEYLMKAQEVTTQTVERLIEAQKSASVISKKLDQIDQLTTAIAKDTSIGYRSYARVTAPAQPLSLSTFSSSTSAMINLGETSSQSKRRNLITRIAVGKNGSTAIQTAMKMERPSRAHIFLSRLHLDSNEGDIENYLRSVNIEWTDIEKLPEKFAGQDYSSFHLTLLKEEREYDDFLDPNLWPEGSFYKRWFTPRLNNH